MQASLSSISCLIYLGRPISGRLLRCDDLDAGALRRSVVRCAAGWRRPHSRTQRDMPSNWASKYTRNPPLLVASGRVCDELIVFERHTWGFNWGYMDERAYTNTDLACLLRCQFHIKWPLFSAKFAQFTLIIASKVCINIGRSRYAIDNEVGGMKIDQDGCDLSPF